MDLEPVPGLERVSFRLGADEDILVALEGEEMEPPELSVEELPVSVVQLSSLGATVLAGEDGVFIDVRERSFRVSAGSFFQVNTPMAAAMVGHILKSLPVDSSKVVLDLYCGGRAVQRLPGPTGWRGGRRGSFAFRLRRFCRQPG